MTRDLADYYHWEEPGRGVRIYMESGMMDRLQADVIAGSGASPAGGILIGRVESEGARTNTIIETYIAVPANVNPEAELLRAALAGCRPGAPAILGYYRGHYGGGLSMSAADVELVENYLPAPGSLFLLLKSMSGQACTAGFFFWEDGRFQGEFSLLEVALGRMAALPSPGAPEVAEPLEPLPLPAPAEKQPVHFWRDLLLRAAIVSLAAVTVVLSVLIYLGAPRASHDSAAAAPTAAKLGLRVERKTPDLVATWDQKAPEIVAARGATLSIRDGGGQKDLLLDKSQLATGSVVYTPLGDDVQFRLEIRGTDGQIVGQSVRVILPKSQ